MFCAYERLPDGRWRCANCSDETSVPRVAPPIRTCHGATSLNLAPGLGDMAAWAFKYLGITPERFSAWLGAPCSCPERQERWNRAGRYLAKRAAKLGIKLPF